MFLKKLIYLFLISIFFVSCNKKIEKPNVIIIITDDQGHGDIGFNGNKVISTPNIDKLAKESVRFNSFYVSPVCAPTRSSLLTGRYSLRTGVSDTYNGGAIMSGSEVTIAEVLASNNYETGIFGKWHLGDNYPSRPSDQGFSESLVHLSGGIGQVGDITNRFPIDSAYFDPVLWLNNKKTKFDGYCSDIFTNEALKFIEKNKDKNFFCYLSFNAPHTPLQLPEKYYDFYKNIDSKILLESEPKKMSKRDVNDAKKIYGMITNIDDNIGKLVNKLEKLGISENTILVFMTDNGPQQIRYNSGLKGLKSDVYEGGIKVPFYLRYPEVFKKSYDFNQISAHIDVLPTIAKLCGVELSNKLKIDGIDLFKKTKNDKINDRSLFSYWTRKNPELYNNISLHKGNYKLIGRTYYNAPISDFELYDIKKDPNETKNIVVGNETTALKLRREMDSFYNMLVNSKNIIDPPRIFLGTKYENPTILNRNDASGQRGIWAQNEIYGYWKVKIEEGKYNFKFKFNKSEYLEGKILLELGRKTYNKNSKIDDSGYISMNGINVKGGEYDLIPTFISRGKNIFPFWIEITRI